MQVLDTNVVSELIRATTAAGVLTYFRGLRMEQVCTTAITEAELRSGWARMPVSRKSVLLRMDLESVLENEIGGRILPFDSYAAKAYARITASRRASGRVISIEDAQIAAIVQVHDATLITRNTRHFVDCGFEVINPWK
jgi:predicted nucleic acid-binding protein